VEAGQSDVLQVEIPPMLRAALARRYGVNRGQLIRVEGTGVEALILNTSRPLLKNNRALRQAINFAVDRAEVVRETPSGFLSRTPTDQMLPHWMPGWKDYDVYPLAKPNLARARQLARGNLRGGHAVLWTIPRLSFAAQARVIASNLRAIGVDVSVKLLSEDVIKAKAGIPGAPYDMILAGEWCCPTSRFPLDYPDPADAVVRLLGGANARKPAGNTNWAYFDEPVYNERMTAADRLSGIARFQAFSKLDADIMRNEAPWVPLHEGSSWLLVSKRVGCLSAHPLELRDLYDAICLR
jgi:ABC-type transport system substrate-binding protein